MEIDVLINLVSSVGFPIAVAGFLMVKTDTTIKKQSECLFNLSASIDKLVDAMGRIEKQ